MSQENPYQAPQATSPPLTNDRSARATAALVLGLISLVGWCVPIVGVPLTIAGLVFGYQGLGSRKRTSAIVGMVLCGIFLSLSLLNAVAGALLFFFRDLQVQPRG